MRIGSALVIASCVCLSRLSSAQNPYEFGQYPDRQNYYYIDTYKTDFGPGGELVRPERSFFKKLFKHWKKWGDDCVQCCPNNPGYKGGEAGNGDYGNGYGEEEQYDDNYSPPFNPQDLPPGHHGHLYLPLPHPHRVMSHLHSYMNRPFRRGYGGKVGPPGYYSSKGVAPAAVKPYEPPPKEGPTDDYQEPAPDEPAPVEPAPEEPGPDEPPSPDYAEKPADHSGEKYDQKEEEVYKDDGGKAYENEDAPVPAPAPPSVTPQVIQPIVPIIAPPVYVYPQQYYPPPPISYGQPYVYPAQPSLSYPATPIQYGVPGMPVLYSAPPQAAVPYSLPAPPSYSPPTPSVQLGPSQIQPQPQAVPAYTPPAPEPSPPEPSYSPPEVIPTYTPSVPEPAAPSYSQVDTSQLQSQSHWHLLPTNVPPPTPLSLYSLRPRPELEGSTLPSPFSNPSECGYVEKTYLTSLTYMQSQSPPPPPPTYYNPLSAPCYGNDQLMRSCPELFKDYQLGLEASPVSRPCGY